MQKLKFINANGVEVDLTSDPFGITEWNGFSNVDLNLQTQQVPFSDGSVYLDGLLSEREISVTLAINAVGDLEKRYRLRRELISVLNPKLGEGTLIYTNDYISKQIKAVPQVPLFETHNSNDAGTPKASLAWTCPNPYWEDVEDKQIIFSIGENALIENEGDVPAQMQIELFGNAENPIIINDTTKKKIAYNGQIENSLLIDTRIGQKKVISETMVFKNGLWGNVLYSVAYSKSKGVFVAVGADGIITYSKDGMLWEVASTDFSPTSWGDNMYYELNKVIYAEEAGIFITVGKNSVIRMSQDGVNWYSPTNYGGTWDNFQDVAYSPDVDAFIIAGTNTLRKSVDNGDTWEVISNTGFACITYLESLHKFAGSAGSDYIQTSTDGTSWDSIPTSLTRYPQVRGIIYSEDLNLYLMYGFMFIYTSSDFTTWTDTEFRTLHPVESINNIIYVSELRLFVASGTYSNWNSTDGTNWVKIDAYYGTYSLWSLVYSENLGKIIIVGGDGLIISSNNAINWQKIQGTGNYPSVIYGVAYSTKEKLFVAIGRTTSNPLISKDGKSWEEVTAINPYFGTMYGITYSKKLNLFITVGEHILASSDGINWTEVRDYDDKAFRAVVYSEKLGIFVAVGTNKSLVTSTDGVTWTVRDSGITGGASFYSVAYNSKLNRFVAVGTKAITSTDGINWTEVYLSTGLLQTVCSNDSLGCFVAGDSMGVIEYSADGINWTVVVPRQYTTAYGRNAIIYSAELNLFIAVGPKIYTSPNGKDWTFHSEHYPSVFYSGVYADDKFVIGGMYSSLFYSEFLPAENKIQNITADSDINLNLVQGKNQIYLTRTSGSLLCRIIFRQKYIGV